MVFEYGVIASDYILTILFLFLIATYYKSRFTNPKRHAFFIFLLFNSHILGFGAALALTIIYLFELQRNKLLDGKKIAMLILVCGFIGTILQLLPHAGYATDATIPPTYFPTLSSASAWTVLTSIQNAFIPISNNFEEIKIPLFFFLGLSVFFLSLIRRISVLVFLFIASLWIYYVFITKVSGYWRYDGLLLIFILFSLWIKEHYSDGETWISRKIGRYINSSILGTFFNTFLILCLIVNSIFGMNSLRKEYLYSYSGAKELKTFINQHNLQNEEIACNQCWSVSLAPYLPKTKFWAVNIKKYETYMITDSVYLKSAAISSEEVLQRVKEKYGKQGLLLTSEPLPIESSSGLEINLLFQNERLTWKDNGENYFLYKITFI